MPAVVTEPCPLPTKDSAPARNQAEGRVSSGPATEPS